MPPGVRVAWVGQFTYFERAKARLKLVIPVTIAIVFFLDYITNWGVLKIFG